MRQPRLENEARNENECVINVWSDPIKNVHSVETS
jgi:hypothetical protein